MRLVFPLVSLFGAISAKNLPLHSADDKGVSSSFETTPRRLGDDIDWLSKYSLKYENCYADNGLIAFRLCPKGHHCHHQCTGGGLYLEDFYTFVDSFTEAQMGGREYACEMVRETCEEEDEDTCYTAAGMDYCIQDDDAFNLQEWLECAEYNDSGYYVAPYCSEEDNYSIYLGLFTDEDCLYPAEEGTFYEKYGEYLPYSVESDKRIMKKDCAHCHEHAEHDNNDADNEDDDDVLEQCEELYENSYKCETDLDTDYPDTSSCGYIEEIVEAEEQTLNAAGSGSGSRWSRMSWEHILFLVLAGVILVGCLLQACLYFDYCKSKKEAEEEQAGGTPYRLA